MFKVLEFTRAERFFTFERKPDESGQKVRVDKVEVVVYVELDTTDTI